MKIKYVSQWVEIDVTLPSPIGSILVEILPDVTPGGDHVAGWMLNMLKKMLNCLQLKDPS